MNKSGIKEFFAALQEALTWISQNEDINDHFTTVDQHQAKHVFYVIINGLIELPALPPHTVSALNLSLQAWARCETGLVRQLASYVCNLRQRTRKSRRVLG